MTTNELSIRKLATLLSVSQPFLSQVRTGTRMLPETLKTKFEAINAYHLLIGDKQYEAHTGRAAATQKEKTNLSDGLSEANNRLAGVQSDS